MTHPTAGVDFFSIGGVDRVVERHVLQAHADPGGKDAPQDLLSRHRIGGTSIFDAPNRYTSYRVAARNLDEIGIYQS
jgi:hypothetical protein